MIVYKRRTKFYEEEAQTAWEQCFAEHGMDVSFNEPSYSVHTLHGMKDCFTLKEAVQFVARRNIRLYYHGDMYIEKGTVCTITGVQLDQVWYPDGKITVGLLLVTVDGSSSEHGIYFSITTNFISGDCYDEARTPKYTSCFTICDKPFTDCFASCNDYADDEPQQPNDELTENTTTDVTDIWIVRLFKKLFRADKL